MPRPGRSLLLPSLTLLPNEMSSNPNSPKDPDLPSSAESEPIRGPFLDRTLETFYPVIVVTNPESQRRFGRSNHHPTARRSVSEGSSRSGSMNTLSYSRWRAGLKLWKSKENPTSSYGDSLFSSLFSNLHVHFEQPFDREEPRPQGTDAAAFSTQFPEGHQLNADFVKAYQLQDELGCGGYGFVMTAFERIERREVAVKFIIKAKVPDHAWMEDEAYGRLPTEVVLLSCINHENIVKCLGLFEDDLYFYMVSRLICFGERS